MRMAIVAGFGYRRLFQEFDEGSGIDCVGTILTPL